MDPVEEIGNFAAFGAFLGALAAYLSLHMDEAAEWAMHGGVGIGSAGALILLGEAVIW